MRSSKDCVAQLYVALTPCPHPPPFSSGAITCPPVFDPSGSIFGCEYQESAQGTTRTVFAMDADGENFRVVQAFPTDALPGVNCGSRLAAAGPGRLIGSCGPDMFLMSTIGGGLRRLHRFGSGLDGNYPDVPPVLATAPVLDIVGTTDGGGSDDVGTANRLLDDAVFVVDFE